MNQLRDDKYLQSKIKPCLTKYYAMKTYGGSEYVDPRTLDLGAGW
jgi:hypothetical protein